MSRCCQKSRCEAEKNRGTAVRGPQNHVNQRVISTRIWRADGARLLRLNIAFYSGLGRKLTVGLNIGLYNL
jgi:hypothetical protein